MRVHTGTHKVEHLPQARRREVDPWGKDKESCELSQKTRSYPGLGEGWT